MQKKIYKYQFCWKIANNNNASTKAPADISYFAEKNGYQKIFINPINKSNKFYQLLTFLQRLFFYNYLFFSIKKKSIIFFQIPGVDTGKLSKILYFALKKIKKIKFISLFHDIEELRKDNTNLTNRKIINYIYKLCSKIILHNEKMISYFVSQGFQREHFINLNIFDYYMNVTKKEIYYDNSIIIAGNLDSSKASFLKEIYKLNGVKINLFGPNFNNHIFNNPNIIYNGTFTPEELPNHLNKGFGLIWDGTSIESCEGNLGNYLKYNNPHKLSLYLGAGLPVIIWNQAAEAEFVIKNKCGITINSLYDLENLNITKEQYLTLVSNTENISKKIRSGFYITTALKECEN